MASNRLEIVVAGDTRQLNQSLGEARKSVDDMVGNIVSQSAAATAALTGITAAGGALVAGFISKAAEMQQFQAQLTAITGSADTAKQQLQAMADFAAKTPFDLPGVVQAGIKLKALGQDSEKYLPIAGNLAAAMGRDIPDAALALGKALSGSQDGIQVLADSYGISRQEMVKYGAEQKSTGAIAVDSAEKLDKLKGALEKIIATKFGNTMEEQAKTLGGAFSNLSDTIGQIQAGFGQELAPAVESVARSVTGVLEAFKNLDPFAKTLIANGALMGTVLTGAAAAGMALQTALLPVTTYLGAFGVAAASSAAANTANAVAAHAAAVALVTQTEAEVAAAAALVAEAQAATLNVATKAQGILAAEGLAIAETELAAATEAAAIANAQYAGTSAAVGSAMGAQTVAAGGLGTAMKGLLFSVGGAALAIGALAGGALILATKSWQEYTDATEKTIAVSKRQLKAFHEQRDVTLEVAAAVKEYGSATSEAVDQVTAAMKRLGKDDLDVTRAIAGNMELRRKAVEDGNEEEIAKLDERIAVLRKVRGQMAGMHQAEVAEAEQKATAAKKVQKANEDLLNSYEDNDKANTFASKAEQLAALDKVLASLGKEHAKRKELALSRVALARDAAKEEASANEKARKEAVDGSQRALDLIVGNDKAAHQQRIALLNKLLEDTRLNSEERHKLQVQLAREELEVSNATAAAKKKAAEDAKKAAEEEAKARQKITAAEIKSQGATLALLQEKFRQGEPVLEQLEAEIKKRDELAAKLDREQVAAEKIGKTHATRAALEKVARAEADAREKTSAMEIEKIRETQAKRKADQAGKAADSTVDQLKQEEEAARKNYDMDSKQFEQLKTKMEERQKAERSALVLKAEQATIGASAEEKAQVLRDLQIDLNGLATKQTEEARALTKEREKQLQLLKDEKKEKSDGFTLGNVGGVESAGDFSAFDVKKQPKADTGAADLAKTKADAAKDKTKAGELATGAIAGNSTLEKMLAELSKQTLLLDTIHKTPTKVDIKGAATASAAATTEKPDWRTSTNKTGS